MAPIPVGPEHRQKAEPIAMLASAIAVALLALPLWAAPLNPYDSGISASAATFTLRGLIPYRDHWLLYGPLSGWLLAIPTALAGPSVGLIHLLGLVLLAAQAVIVYRLCRRWTNRLVAFTIAVPSSLIVAAFSGLAISAWTLSMTLALLALSLRLDRHRPFLVGVLVGLAFLARLDVGAYALLAALVLPDRRRTLAGFASIVVPVALGLLAVVPVASLLEQLVWYPLVGPRQYRGLPGLETYTPSEYVVPLTAVLAVLPRLAIALALVRALADGERPLLSLAVFAGLCQLQTFGRADAAHVAVATTPSLVLIAAIIPRRRATSLIGIAVVAPVLLGAAAIGMVIAWSAPASRDPALLRAISVVRQATGTNDPIFVGEARNRYTLLNPILAYYLADRPPGTRWTMYNPGVTNTDRTQEGMVADLEATRTNVMILDVEFAEVFEVSNDSRLAGSMVLDRYIADRFRIWCDFGGTRVAVRIAWDPDSPCPDPVGDRPRPVALGSDGPARVSARNGPARRGIRSNSPWSGRKSR